MKFMNQRLAAGITIIIAIVIAILVPILLTPWKVLEIGPIAINLLGYDYNNDVWVTDIVFTSEKNMPESKMIFSPIWSPPKGSEGAEPRLLRCQEVRISSKPLCQEGYVLVSGKGGVLSWPVIMLEAVVPLLIGVGIFLIIKRSKSG